MPARSNFHTHTVFCDGKNTPDELVLRAIELGFESIGFSGHATTPHDMSYCMSSEGTDEYFARIDEAKRKYGDRIRILAGLEQDFYSLTPPDPRAEFLIMSVHYIKKNGHFIEIDGSRDALREAIDRDYGGDAAALASDYFALVGETAERDGAGILGHIDLLTKFDESGEPALFDQNDSRYVAAYTDAVRRAVRAGVPIEINTGAVARGVRKTPYPSCAILRLVAESGGRVIFSSDCHDADFLGFGYDDALALARECGIFGNDFAKLPKRYGNA